MASSIPALPQARLEVLVADYQRDLARRRRQSLLVLAVMAVLIFLAARMKIPRDLYDAAEIDGATGVRRFIHITLPLLANLYFLCTLLSTLWTVGDFTTVYLVSGGGPAGSTDVLATLGFRYAFDHSRPELGVAVVMSALPLLIALVIALMRRAQTSEVQL